MKAKYIYPSLLERKKQSHVILQTNRTYALRSSRITDSQKKHYEQGMHQYGISNDVLGSSAVSPSTSLHSKIQKKTEKKFQSLIIDIGFGYGTSLLDYAERKKDSLFIGIEVYQAGIGALYKEGSKRDLDDILVYHEDALKVLFYEVEDESIEGFHVFFPDPWHKKKHNKRRLLTKEVLLLMYQLLVPKKGYLYFLSDNEDYRNELYANIVAINAMHQEKLIFWKEREPRSLALRQKTKFELRGLELNNDIHSLVVQRDG